MEIVCGCFGRMVNFTLTPHPTERIPFWGSNEDIVVLHYKPNPEP